MQQQTAASMAARLHGDTPPTLRQQRVAMQRQTAAASPTSGPTAVVDASSHAHASSQAAQIRALQAALHASQQALAAASAPAPMHAVYATPAAWHRHRQFLLAQPTPKQLPSLDELQQMQRAVPKHMLPEAAELFAQQQLQLQLQSQAADSHSATALAAAASSSSASGSARHPTSSPTPAQPAPRRASLQPQSRGPPPLLHQRSYSTSPAMRGLSSSGAGGSAVANGLGADTQLAHVQASLRHLKALQVAYEEEKATQLQKSRIQKTFLSLSSFLIVLFVAILTYYDYLIIAPHIQSLFWALLFWVVLDAPQRWLLRLFSILDARFLNTWAVRLELVGLLATLALGLVYSTELGVLLALGVAFLLYTFFLFGDRYTVTAALLLLCIMLLLAFPLFFLAKTCVLESAEIAARLRVFIEANPEFQHILEDFSSSATFLWLQSYCRSWGYEIPATDVARLRELILKSIVQFADQLTHILTGVYGLLTNLSQMLVSLVTFASVLYFLLASNRDFSGTLVWLSPFSADDNAKLVSTMKRSVLRIFVCSLSVGVLHVVVTYVSFSMCGIDLCLILSFLSGLAAMLPIFSSWIIWLPACGGLLLAGRHASAALLAAIQMTLLLYVDPLILSNIPGDPFIVGMSIVFAVMAFGASGVLVGPLLAGVTFTFLSIYKEYLSMPLFTNAPHHAPGTQPPPIATAPGALPVALPVSAPGQIGPDYLSAAGPTSHPAAFSKSNAGGGAFDPLSARHRGPDAQNQGIGPATGSLAQPPLFRSASTPNAHGHQPLPRAHGQVLASPLPSNPSRTLRFATPLQRHAGTGDGDHTHAATPFTPSGSPSTGVAAPPSSSARGVGLHSLPATPASSSIGGRRGSASASRLAARQATPAADSIVEADEESCCSVSSSTSPSAPASGLSMLLMERAASARGRHDPDLSATAESDGHDAGESGGAGDGAASAAAVAGLVDGADMGTQLLATEAAAIVSPQAGTFSPVLLAPDSAAASASASASASPALFPSTTPASSSATPLSPELWPSPLGAPGLSPPQLSPAAPSVSSPEPLLSASPSPSLLSPSPSPTSSPSPSSSSGASATGLAVRLERARVESAHSRLIAHLEAELRAMQQDQCCDMERDGQTDDAEGGERKDDAEAEAQLHSLGVDAGEENAQQSGASAEEHLQEADALDHVAAAAPPPGPDAQPTALAAQADFDAPSSAPQPDAHTTVRKRRNKKNGRH